MQEDVRRAIDIGLDQICIYHLVLFRGLGTPWSRDKEMLASLPENEKACENWLVLRQDLLDRGYRQTTLTNFERREFEHDPRQYRYESVSFEADHCQVLGYGPGGISYVTAPDGHSALKTMNPEGSTQYVKTARSEGPVWDRYYEYDFQDLKLLHLTRRLAALSLKKEDYRLRFGGDPQEDFGDELALLIEKGLLVDEGETIVPTPRGMFYADSIAGLLAEDHLRVRRRLLMPADGDDLDDPDNDNSMMHM